MLDPEAYCQRGPKHNKGRPLDANANTTMASDDGPAFPPPITLNDHTASTSFSTSHVRRGQPTPDDIFIPEANYDYGSMDCGGGDDDNDYSPPDDLALPPDLPTDTLSSCAGPARARRRSRPTPAPPASPEPPVDAATLEQETARLGILQQRLRGWKPRDEGEREMSIRFRRQVEELLGEL
jgi:hypothetical protein